MLSYTHNILAECSGNVMRTCGFCECYRFTLGAQKEGEENNRQTQPSTFAHTRFGQLPCVPESFSRGYRTTIQRESIHTG